MVQDFKAASQFEDFMVVYNRSHNLSKKWDSTIVKQEVLTDESEKKLYQQYLDIKEAVEQKH